MFLDHDLNPERKAGSSSPEVAEQAKSRLQEESQKACKAASPAEKCTVSSSGAQLTDLVLVDGSNNRVDSKQTRDTNSEAQAAESSGSGHYGDVAKDIAGGAVDEVTQHFGKVVLSGAEGVAAGVAISLLSPELAVTAAVVAGGYGIYKLAGKVGDWVDDAETVAYSAQHDAGTVEKAHDNLRGIGAAASILLPELPGAFLPGP